MTQDPWGNSLPDDAIEYNLSGGNPLEAGEDATIDVGTSGDFSGLSYDILIHDQGDSADDWLPIMIGGSDFDPSDTFEFNTVPEPCTLGVLSIGGIILLGRRRRN